MAGVAMRGRGRMLVLFAVTALGLVSYLSFIAYVRPKTSAVPFDDESSLSHLVNAHSNTTADATTPPRILLVSAFFPLSKSKHTMHDYRNWLARFLQPIDTDIYMFVPPEMESLVRELRGARPLTLNTTFSSPFDIPPLAGLEDRYAKMHTQDREKHRHSPELYAVWAGKPYFLDEAVRNAGVQYDYAFWSDAGSFRDEHRYAAWPDARRVQRVWEEGSRLSGTPQEDLLFFPTYGMPRRSMHDWREDMGPVDDEFSEGSFFGGSPKTIAWWRTLYFAYHDLYLSRDIFVGKDQTLINALFLLHPSRIITVWLSDPDAPAHRGLVPFVDEGYLGNCGSDWYYYQFWLAGAAERTAMRALWEKQARWSWGWWRERETCRLTRVLDMTGLLTHHFGEPWHAPSASLDIP